MKLSNGVILGAPLALETAIEGWSLQIAQDLYLTDTLSVVGRASMAVAVST